MLRHRDAAIVHGPARLGEAGEELVALDDDRTPEPDPDDRRGIGDLFPEPSMARLAPDLHHVGLPPQGSDRRRPTSPHGRALGVGPPPPSGEHAPSGITSDQRRAAESSRSRGTRRPADRAQDRVRIASGSRQGVSMARMRRSSASAYARRAAGRLARKTVAITAPEIMRSATTPHGCPAIAATMPPPMRTTPSAEITVIAPITNLRARRRATSQPMSPPRIPIVDPTTAPRMPTI